MCENDSNQEGSNGCGEKKSNESERADVLRDRGRQAESNPRSKKKRRSLWPAVSFDFT
jgi:hypothetical protein